MYKYRWYFELTVTQIFICLLPYLIYIQLISSLDKSIFVKIVLLHYVFIFKYLFQTIFSLEIPMPISSSLISSATSCHSAARRI